MTDRASPCPERSAPGPVVIEVGADGVVTMVTDGMPSLLGWEPADLVGRELVTIIPERFRGPHREAFDRFVESGWSRHEGHTLTLPAITSDGLERDVGLLLASRSTPTGRSVVGIVRAASETGAAEVDELVERVRRTLQQLLAADRPMREVLAAAVEPVATELGWPIGVLWAFDPWVERLTALHVWEREPGAHPAYIETTRDARFARGEGFAKQVWASQETWWSADLPAEPDFRRAPQAAADGVRSGVFLPIHSASGMIGVLELVDEAERGVDAETHRSLRAIAAELARHLAERLRRETEAIHRERLQIALSGGGMGMWTFHVPTRQVTWDRTLEEAHGLAPGSFGGTFDSFVEAIHSDDRAAVLDVVGKAMEQQCRFDVTYRTIGVDGATRWIRGSGAPLHDREGELQTMTGIARDATEEILDQDLLHRRASGAALAADVGRALVSDETIEARLGRVVEAFVEHLEVAFARIWTLAPGDDVLILRASAGLYRHLDGEHARVPVGQLKIGRIAAAGRSHVTSDLLNDPQLSDPEWARREGMQAFAGFPLLVQDRCVGVVGVFSRSELTGDVVGSLASITDSLAVAIVQNQEAQRVRELLVETQSQRERAEILLGERQRVASVLQESLLPPTLPAISGLDVAGAYRPGVDEVGGDFYDLFPLGSDRWGFMIGDVCGRGPEAARYTALARHSLRTALLLEQHPERALAALDRALHATDTDGRFCSAVCGVVSTDDDGSSSIQIGVAGHPAPIVVRADGTVDEVTADGPLLGVVPDASFHEQTWQLRSGDALVMYTDGTIEARGVDGLFGFERLKEEVAVLAGGSAGSITDGLVAAVNAYDDMLTHDDLAVLTLRCE